MPKDTSKKILQKIAVINKALAIIQSKTKDKTRQLELLAKEHNVNPSTIRRWIERYQKGGPEALIHTRARRQNPIRSFDQEALNYLCLLISRHPNQKLSQIYQLLAEEAKKSGWRIGSRASYYRLIERLCLDQPSQKITPPNLKTEIESKLSDLTPEQLSLTLSIINHFTK